MRSLTSQLQEEYSMPHTRPKAVPTVQIENDRVIVTEWRFAPGAETGWHRHGHDYVVVPGLKGKLLLETKDGDHIAELDAGKSYGMRLMKL